MFTVTAYVVNDEGTESTIVFTRNGTVAQMFVAVGQIVEHMQSDNEFWNVTHIDLTVVQ